MSKIKLDFQVLTIFDPKLITVVDTSYWGEIEGKPSIIEITMPGESKPVVHYFDKFKFNILNSHNLGINCSTCSDIVFSELPDGIYHITIKGSPDSFSITKQFLKTDSTRLKLDEFIVSTDLNCHEFSKELIERIQKINLFIEAAESNTRLGNYEEAQQLLFRAQKHISKLKGCKVCV